jgi:hypothetical protein
MNKASPLKSSLNIFTRKDGYKMQSIPFGVSFKGAMLNMDVFEPSIAKVPVNTYVSAVKNAVLSFYKKFNAKPLSEHTVSELEKMLREALHERTEAGAV